MKKIIAAVLVVMMITAMLFASTRALFIKNYSFDSIYVNDLENPVVNNGRAGQWAAENPIEGDIENLRVRGWATIDETDIVGFGYQIDDKDVYVSPDYILDRPDVQGAFGLPANVANGFDITMFVGDEAQGTHLVTLFVAGADGSIEEITSFEFTQGYREPINPPTGGGDEVIHNPDDTMVVWMNKDEFAVSWDTLYINGVSQMDLGWGGDGAAAYKLEENQPLAAYDIDTFTIRGWAGLKDGDVVEWGYRINGGENVYDESFTKPTEDAVIYAGGDSRFEIVVPVNRPEDPVLITAVAKDGYGNEYDFIQFSLNGQYEGSGVVNPPIGGDKIIHNPDDTMTVWMNKDEFAVSWDTLYINGVSHMDLGWGADGGAANKLESQQPVFAGDIDTFTIRGWAGLRDGDVVEWGYRINGGENVYDASFTKTTEDAVIGAGGDSRFEIVVPVNRPEVPVLITAVAKDEYGNEYDFIQFSLNGQYEGGVVNPPIGGDGNQWLCGEEPDWTTPAWWFNPVGEPDDRHVDIHFYSDINFTGIHGFYYCSNTQNGFTLAVMNVELLKDGEVVASRELAVDGDDWADTDFGTVFGQGEYMLRFSCKSGSGVTNECWCVLAGAPSNSDAYVECFGATDSTDGSYRPAIMLIGTDEEPYYPAVYDSVDIIQKNSSVAGEADNLAYGETINIDPGDKLYTVGWAFSEEGAPLEKIIYTIDGKEYECSDVYRDRPDVAVAFGDVVPEEGRNAGFGKDDEMIELLGIDELPEGFYRLGFIAVFEDGLEVEFFSSQLIIGDMRRWLEKPVDGMLNIIIDGGTKMNEARRGETVDVKIELVNNPGICSLRTEIYWSDYLKLKNAEYDIYGENPAYELANEPNEYDYFEGATWEDVGNMFVFNWINANGKAEGDRTFVTLTFEVAEDAPLAEFLYVDAFVDGVDVFADLGDDVDFVVISGGVDVIPDPGDVDCDSYISNRDVVMLFRYVNGSDFRLIKKAADVNLDGAVNNKDVVELFRMSSALDR